MKSIIKLENVSKYYKNAGNVSMGIEKINLEFSLGEFIAVTGQSGSGKSTLMNVISGLDSYEDGELYLNGEETSHFSVSDWETYRSKNIGFIFQNYNIIDSFTVYQNVLLALEIQNYPKKDRKRRALELIEKVGLTSHKNHKASKLSGGQKQRTVIARALAKDCQIIVADEPTGNLDSKSGKEVIDLLREIAKEKLIIIVTHNYDQIKDYVTRSIHMHDGQVIEDKILKEVEPVEKIIESDDTRMSFRSTSNVALRNILSMPKKTVFFISLQLIIIVLFFFIFTSISTSVFNSRIGSGGYLNENKNDFGFYTRSATSNRIFVIRKDGKKIEEEDLKFLNNLPETKEVIGHISSIDSSYYEGNIQYSIANTQDKGSDYSNFKIDSTFAIDDKPQFLIDGSFNNLKDNEVILSKDYTKYSIGTIIKLSIRDNSIRTKEVEKELVGTNLVRFSIHNEKYSEIESIEVFNKDGSNFTLSGNHYHEYLVTLEESELIDKVFFKYYSFDPIIKEYTVKGHYNSNGKIIYFNNNLFKDSTNSLNYGATILLKNDKSANRLFNSMDQTKYRVIYPDKIQSQMEIMFAPLNFIIKLIGYVGIFFSGIFLYFLLFTVMKNVMATRKKDLAIFRSIGANEKNIGFIIIIEQIFMMLISFTLSLVIIEIMKISNVNIYNQFSIMTIFDYVIVLFIFVILSIRLAFKFNKKTFKISIIENISESKESLI